ncbi:MAG TPA: HD domain-containing protein [Alphaproteobacteria bacterium]|nr:HD domain-containing protein [Alphaproteobacteria bacterium]
MDVAKFASFDESTAEDWALIDAKFQVYAKGHAERVLAALERLGGGDLGYRVDRLEHSLQTATRAFRAGADEETVVCALLHDIGDDLAPHGHGALAASIVEPYVSRENAWLVRHHEVFQGYHYQHFFGSDRYAREKYRGHAAFERTIRFCDEWDQTSFDPDYDSMPLTAFAPMVGRILARTPWDAAHRQERKIA